MILFLHNRYRTVGGEERVVEDLLWLVREHLQEDAEELIRDSAVLGRARAATALLGGGMKPDDVRAAVKRTRARVVHAHNVLPSFGWRALAAARDAGARTVLHRHNYRLVCAVGTCLNSRGEDCTRCQGKNTLPGIRLNCRGNLAESVSYAAAIAAWNHRIPGCADAIVVPSRSALERLHELKAPLHDRCHVLPSVQRRFADAPRFDPHGPAIVASRLAREKGIDTAIEACRIADTPLVVAGDGPEEEALRRRADGADVRFTGRLAASDLDALRATCSLALMPSRSAEVFPVAAIEAMAAGLPAAGSRIGALPELLEPEALAPPGDAMALAKVINDTRGSAALAEGGLARVRELCDPANVAEQLRAIYEA